MTHIKGYIRADGTFVKDHEDSREKTPWWVKVLDKVKNPPPSHPAHGGYGKFPSVHYPKAKVHPALDDKGKPVSIHQPHTETPDITWAQKAAIATFTPGSPVPKALNGVPFAPWTPPTTQEGWAEVEGQRLDIREPILHQPGEAEKGHFKGFAKGIAAGVIIEEEDGRVWVIHPTNEFGGYKGTFPKGHQEKGMGLQATAIKEAFEESGLKVEITGFAGDVERTTTLCRYYTARRTGGTPQKMGWETQALSLVPRTKLYGVLNRPVDHDMAEALGAGPKPPPPPMPAYSPKYAGEKPSGGYPWGKDKGPAVEEPSTPVPWWDEES